MSDKEKSLPPSLDLAFEWVKDVLTDQIKEVNALDTKVVALFSVGTAIISLGLGIPLGISVLPFNILLSSVFGWLTFISYICIVLLASLSLWVRYYERLKNPIIIRKWYWDMVSSEFKINILSHLEGAYIANQKKLLLKGWAIRLIVPMIGIEALVLILFLAYGL